MEDPHFVALQTRVEAIVRPSAALLTYYLVLSLLGLVAFPVLFLPLYFRYHTLHFRFDEQGVSMGYGILFRKEMHLTFARMQDIHLSQNLLERWLGIGTVTIQTAGASGGGDLAINGVALFEDIRDYLYARMRGVRPATPSAEGLGGPGALTLLGQIRDELRASSRALSGGKR